MKRRLSRSRHIKLSVTGRKSGKPISMPVCFVLEGEKLYLVPGRGSDTEGYRKVREKPSIQRCGRRRSGTPSEATVSKAVKSVLDKFREKVRD